MAPDTKSDQSFLAYIEISSIRGLRDTCQWKTIRVVSLFFPFGLSCLRLRFNDTSLKSEAVQRRASIRRKLAWSRAPTKDSVLSLAMLTETLNASQASERVLGILRDATTPWHIPLYVPAS